MINDKNPLSDKAIEFLKLVRQHDESLVPRYRGIIKNRGLSDAIKLYKQSIEDAERKSIEAKKQKIKDKKDSQDKFIKSLQLLKASHWLHTNFDTIQAKLLEIVNEVFSSEYITAELDYDEDFRLDPPIHRLPEYKLKTFMIDPLTNPDDIITIGHTKVYYSIKNPVDLSDEFYSYPNYVTFKIVIYYDIENNLVLDFNNNNRTRVIGVGDDLDIFPKGLSSVTCNSLESFYKLITNVTNIINSHIIQTKKFKQIGLRKIS